MQLVTNHSNTSGFEKFRNRPYFKSLDGLRAISILLVLWHHVPLTTATHLAALQENGRYGVSFFFVISGFLITTLFLREQRANGHVALLSFYGRRALRLLPLYYLALGLQAALVLGLHLYTAENEVLFRTKLSSYIFYYSNWLPSATAGPFFQAWSLAVEEQFYLVFGLLFFAARPPLIILLVSVALSTKIFIYSVYGNVDVESTAWRIVFSYQEPILWGVLMAFILNTPNGFKLFQPWLGQHWVMLGLGLLTAAWLFIDTISTQSSWDAQILYLLMSLVVASAVIRAETRFLELRFLTHVGKISYGIYLFHMFAISGVKRIPWGNHALVNFLFSTLIIIAAATLVFRYFEAPIIAFYKRRLSPTA